MKPQDRHAEKQPLHTSALLLVSGWERLAAEHNRVDPHTLHDALHDELTHTILLPKASPLSCRPSGLAAPEQQRQSLGRSQLSASEAMVDQHRLPQVPGSGVPP